MTMAPGALKICRRDATMQGGIGLRRKSGCSVLSSACEHGISCARHSGSSRKGESRSDLSTTARTLVPAMSHRCLSSLYCSCSHSTSGSHDQNKSHETSSSSSRSTVKPRQQRAATPQHTLEPAREASRRAHGNTLGVSKLRWRSGSRSWSSSVRSSHHRHHRSSSRCSDSSHRRNLSEVMTFRFACIQKSYLHRLSGPVQGEQGGDYDDAGVGMAYHVSYGRATSTTATITRVACGCTLRRPRQ